MTEDIRTHVIGYFILLLILGLGLFGFVYFSYSSDLRRAIVLTVAAFYIIWGVAHHLIDGNLNFKIVVEYMSVAVLAATLLLVMVGASGS